MGKKYYPAKHSSRRRYPVQRGASSPVVVKGGVPNIFANNRTLRHEVADGRIHCVAIKRTAIYKDANGNKIVLKENQTTMNAPETMRGGVEFRDDDHGKWRRK